MKFSCFSFWGIGDNVPCYRYNTIKYPMYIDLGDTKLSITCGYSVNCIYTLLTEDVWIAR
jgi:hypothetical protein